MAEKGSVHPITKKTLEKHLEKVDGHLESVNRGATEFASFFELCKGIGTNKNMMPKEAQDTIEALRTGFSLYYEMNAILEDRVKELNSDIPEQEKRLFSNAYSMFAASSYIENKLSLLSGNEEPFPFNSEGIKFTLDLTKDDSLNNVLAKYYGLINSAKRNEVLESGTDVPRGSVNFFKFLKEQALTVKPALNKKLVDLVANSEFRITDEFTLSGFQSNFDSASKMPKIEFVKVEPGDVVANEVAKRKVFRYMDRLALFDLKAKNNPCVVLGGLSWTNLWDGIPGTGKTMMMRMAMTRLAGLCEITGMKYKIHSIDQSVKSEFYGKTGQNAIAEFNSTKDPNFLHLTILDDLDLLTQVGRSESGGADNDLRNVIMQFLDGAFTLRNGSNQVYSASNEPKNLDPAVRNRHNDRILVEGPKTAEDFADMTFILTKSLREAEIFNIALGYTPLATQDNYIDGKWTKPSGVVYAVDPEFAKRFKKKTIRDFGQYLFELKQKNPFISGRSVKSIIEAIKERTADFDVPIEFFTDRAVYLDQPFERKIEILKPLYMKVNDSNSEILFQEAERYAQSEARYAQGEEEREIGRGYNGRIWGLKAEIQALREHPELYGEEALLRNKMREDKDLLKGIIERVNAGAKTKK